MAPADLNTSDEPKPEAHPLLDVVRVCLKLGFIGFGGPAVVVGMLEEEVVARRRWLTRQYFLDLLGATNLIPGPNSTEMMMHVGYLRAGFAGLVAGGLCFIVPAAILSGLFAWMYVKYGSVPEAAPFLYGIKPAALAVIAAAMGRLLKGAAKNRELAALGLFVFIASMLQVGEVLALFTGGLIGMFWLRSVQGGRSSPGGAAGIGLFGFAISSRAAAGVTATGAAAAATAGAGVAAGAGIASVPLVSLALFFLKVGALLYGSGYVLVAFLQGGLVRDHQWLTQQQLLDAISVGQFTPGPLLSTATFIGYVLAGTPGAIVATACIFGPSFLFVAATSPIVPRLRKSPWIAAFLDAINMSAIALIAAVAVKLAGATLFAGGAIDVRALLIALLAGAAAFRWQVNAAWLILGGGVLGWLLMLAG